MNVLLIGHTGQLGQYVMAAAEQLDWKVDGVTSSELDITDPIQLSHYFSNHQYQWVINTAAFHDLQQAEQQPAQAFELNTLAVRSLAQLSQQHSFRLMTFSTDYVFDGNQTEPYTETDQAHPLQVYGTSKLAGEYLALAVNPETVVIRTAALYGAQGSVHKGTNFILSMIAAGRDKQAIEVAGNQVTTSTYAYDLAAWVVAAVQQDSEGGVYHVTNQGPHSWAELASLVMTETDSTCQVIPVNRDFSNAVVARPLYSALSSEKSALLNLPTLRPWQDAARAYINELITKGLV